MANRVNVVDTVLGAVAPPGPARTGTVAQTVPTAEGPDALIARGCLNPNDGGGGLFVWRTDSSHEDDNGTIILPNEYLPLQPINGRWHRVYSGAIDIRWFGAQAGGAAVATDAIANAIAAAAGSGPAAGAEVFVPPGEFLARLRLPRSVSGLTIRGAGIRTSQIVWNGSDPVVDFVEPHEDAVHALNYCFRSIMFRHTLKGATAFAHDPKPGSDARLLYAMFEDVAFFSLGVLTDAQDQPAKNSWVAELRSMFNSHLNRVWFNGSLGMVITGSRNFLTGVKTFQDAQQVNGVVMVSSETVVDLLRIDGLKGHSGVGLLLEDATNLTIRNTSFEGKEGRSCISIKNCTNITLDNCDMGGGPPVAEEPWAALDIAGSSENIRINGGRINVFDTTGIKIDAGVRSVHGKAIEVAQASRAVLFPPFVQVDPAAADIRIEAFTSTDARAEFAQTTGTARMRGTTLLLQRWKHVRVTGMETIEDIAQGNEGDGPGFGSAPVGRRVMLLLSGGAVTVSGAHPSTIRLSAGEAWTPVGEGMIELLFDGRLWHEVARSG